MNMPTVPSVEELVQVVHGYFPRIPNVDDPSYKESEEAQRLRRLLETTQGEMFCWTGFVERVRKTFPDRLLWDKTVPYHDPCYHLHVGLPGVTVGGGVYNTVACLLSLLAPVYVIYATHVVDNPRAPESRTYYPPLPEAFQSLEQRLAGLVEESFGFARLPSETLFVPVPGLRPRTGHFIGKEPVLADLLFTPYRQ